MSDLLPANQPPATDATQIITPADGPTDIDAFLDSLGADFEYAPTIAIPSASDSSELSGDDGAGNDGDDDEDDDSAQQADGSAPESIIINGNTIPLSEVQRLVDFDTFLKSNPTVAQRMAESIAAPAGFPPVPQGASPPGPPASAAPASQVATPTTTPAPTEFVPPTPPETLDLEDPTVKFLWDQTVDARREAFEARQSAASIGVQSAQTMQQLTARQAELDMQTAISDFTTAHPNINADDIATIRKYAAEINILPGLMSTMSPVAALNRAMEVAAWAHDTTRAKMLDPNATSPTATQTTRTRKQRLAQLSSTSGSAPRTDNAPRVRSDRDMINQFAQELADSGFGR